MRRLFVIAAASWLLWNCTSVILAAEFQKSVLLLYDSRNDMLSNVVVDGTIRRVLNEQFTVDLDIRSEYLDTPPTPKADFPILLSWLGRKYSGRTFDVVVPVGANALQFVREYGQEFLRRAHIVYWGRKAALDALGSDVPVTGVVAPEMESQIKGTFAFIRALQPDLKRLVVVSGASSVDRNWYAAARRELGPFEGPLEVTYLSGLSLEEVQNRLASLPQKTAILLLSITEDAAGRRLLRTQFLSKLIREAAAPVYSTGALYLDTGFVGGALLDQETMAVAASGLVVRLLRGENIRQIPVLQASLVPMANWKALRRWRLDESKLPNGTVVKYKDQSAWDMYKWDIVGAISLCLLEGGLIVGLLVQRTSRRRAEKAMMESRQLLQTTIDALNARVALLDQDGTIIAVNRRWKSFDETNPNGATNIVGSNYLQLCAARPCGDAHLISDGIQRLISGELPDFRRVYPIVRGERTTWFQIRINRLETFGAMRLVVTQEDVTEIKQAHDAQEQLTGLLMRAQDEERRRIARDLHDVTVQNMVAIKADLTCVERASESNPFDASEMLRESVSLCDQVIKELRTLSYLLHPPFLDEAGLGPALRWFVRGFIQRSGIQVELLVPDDIGRLPTEVETALFRVVQESLTNIHRHSGSGTAVIRVTRENNTVALRVQDQGHGISMPAMSANQEAPLSPGVGIEGMRQRMRQLGGQLDVESSPQGTSVTAKVPISEDLYAAYLSSR